jgi:hypothetical protein
MLGPHQIRQFYLRGFKDTAKLNEWPCIWRKQFKIRTIENHFMKLNRLRNRLNFKSLLGLCVRYTPLNLYMSTLNWLMPERVGEKVTANHALPLEGEYVADIDIQTMMRGWGGVEGFSISGLQFAHDRTLSLVDKIRENYSDLRVVFSGRRGFHVHVLDFKVRDWTHYNEEDPIKSHEVARFLYTRYIKSALGEISKYHFILSTDPMRVMTVPGSLNGRTGKICFLVGDPLDFERLSLEEVIRKSDSRNYLYNNGFQEASSLIQSHPEPNGGR